MKAQDATLVQLSRGLRLVHHHQAGAASGIFGIAVRAGSADEAPDKYGLAHFVEHTIFKGTKARKSWHLINRMEAVGGELNAYTTKEETVLYTIFPTGQASRAVDLVADLAINSVFPIKEIEKEREVVIDEINSYLDIPSEAIYDDFEELVYGNGPLGHNILGNPETVRALSSDDCRGFLHSNYTRRNIVAFYSGNLGAERVASMVERYFSEMEAGRAIEASSNIILSAPKTAVKHLDTHQAHCIVGTPMGGIKSPERHAVALLANIVAGPGMNSLLNLELRERRGLVYNVEASTAVYTHGGLLSVYFGCDPDDVQKCLKLCSDTFRKLGSGFMDKTRLEKAKKQYLGQLSIAAENRENRIMAAARSVLFRGEVPDTQRTVQAFRDIKPEDIQRLASKFEDPYSLVFSD